MVKIFLIYLVPLINCVRRTHFINLMVYLKICQWILKQLFTMTEILFVLIPRYCCFKVSRAPPLPLSNYNGALGRRIFEDFKVWILRWLLETSEKSTKWSTNNFPNLITFFNYYNYYIIFHLSSLDITRKFYQYI